MTPRRPPIEIAGTTVSAGKRKSFEIPVARLVTGSMLSLPVIVIHGATPGPTLWISAALHGDEIGGVEIIRRVTERVRGRDLAGTLIAVPIVNVFGFVNGDRYLPDRRDLNRSFPGSRRGSLAARIAHLFMTEIVGRCDVGLDLHTGSDHRTNWPQIRADLDDPRVRDCATAFAPPVLIHARTRDGSLREAATAQGAAVLLYEGGEAHRFDPHALACGTEGALRLMHHLGMIESAPASIGSPPIEARSTKWVRAGVSGIFSIETELGEAVEARQPLGLVHDSYGRKLSTVRAQETGWVIGQTQHPLVNRGDALVNLAAG